MPRIVGLPPTSEPLADGDLLPIHNVSTGDTEKTTLTKLKEYLQALVGWITTAMIADGAVTSAKINPGITTGSNGGSGGGTYAYWQVGNIKYLTFDSATYSLSSGAVTSRNFTFPFTFTTVYAALADVHDLTTDARQYAVIASSSTSSISCNVYNPSASNGGGKIFVTVIGV